MLKHIFTLSLFLISILPLTQAQTNSYISEEVKEKLDARVDNGIYAGVVVGVIDSKGVQYYSYGLKSSKSNEKVDENSIFEIGSISKTFTGTILASMVEKGEVKLDDPLQKYLPEGVTAPTRNGRSITLAEMSNHTSGLPRMPNNFNPANPANPYVDYTEEQLYAFLNGYELTRDIGSEFEYSNYAVGLLGHVLATKKKMTYEELMIKTIADPLKLKNTRTVLTPKMKDNLAIGHSGGVEVENWDLTTLAGAGAIRSTTIDMAKYIKANMGLKKNKLSSAIQLSHQNTRPEGSEPEIGLGWIIMDVEGTEIIWHNGGTGGYRTFAGFINGGDKGVIVMTNTDVSVDDIGRHILNSKSPMLDIKPSITNKIRDIIDSEGIEAGTKAYWQMKKEHAEDYDFSETELNNLGYYYLGKEEVDKAIAVLEINAEAYPEAFNVYDSMGEAFMINGENEKAITNYKKSVEINPSNQGGIDMLKKLGVNTDDLTKEVKVDDETLKSYVGQYELMPGFILTVSKEGNQINAQATGQPMFPIYPKSENEFYYKVVVAELTFNKNDNGDIESVTLFQGGQELTGKKLVD